MVNGFLPAVATCAPAGHGGMAMSGVNGVNTNVPSIQTLGAFGRNSAAAAGSLERLSTGYRINRGADDPSGLIASENLRAALASLDAETRTIERADAVTNVADGALGQISELLGDAQARAVANANTAGVSDAERQANQLEIDSAIATADRIASTTRFNGTALLDGTATINAAGASLTIASAGSASIGEVTINGENYRLRDVRSGGALNTVNGNIEGAASALGAAIQSLVTERGRLGAFSANTLGAQARSNQVAVENTAAAESSIRDTDFARETAALARANALSNSNLAAAGLANTLPGAALRLVR